MDTPHRKNNNGRANADSYDDGRLHCAPEIKTLKATGFSLFSSRRRGHNGYYAPTHSRKMSSTDFVSSSDFSIGSTWGRIIFFTMMTSASCHAAWSLFAVAKLVPKRPRFVLVPIAYFAMGLVYAFLRCAVLAFAISTIHFTLKDGINVGELAVYVFGLCFLCLFSSAGRIPLLYSL